MREDMEVWASDIGKETCSRFSSEGVNDNRSYFSPRQQEVRTAM